MASQSPLEVTLFCWVFGDSDAFPVDINLHKTIGHLKKAVVRKKPNRFREIDPDELKLCVANIPDTDEARVGFTFGAVLPASKEIFKVFPSGELPDDQIHIAIKRPAPPSESFLFTIHAQWGRIQKKVMLDLNPSNASLSDFIPKCCNLFDKELHEKGPPTTILYEVSDKNWAQLVDDEVFRHILRVTKTDEERALHIKLDEPKKSAFSSCTDISSVLSGLGINSMLERLPVFFPRMETIPENDTHFVHCLEIIKEKLRGFGDALKNKAVRREFISAVLLTAVLLVPDTMLAAETSVIGDEEHGRVDYGIFNNSELICISEAKESEMVQGTAINLVQCKRALQENKRKRKRADDFDYIYGITTTADQWRYILLTSDGSVSRTKYAHTLPLHMGSIDDDKALRENLKAIVATIVWMLKDRADGDEAISQKAVSLHLFAAQRLCNGTRMTVAKLGQRCIEVCILGGDFDGQIKLIPRILLCTTEAESPFILTRKQFPIKLAFTMTVNKSQGQILGIVGLDLHTAAFTHGQLYVAMSRVTNVSNLAVLYNGDGSPVTENVVYPEVLLSMYIVRPLFADT